jgi:hypothetical protein
MIAVCIRENIHEHWLKGSTRLAFRMHMIGNVSNGEKNAIKMSKNVLNDVTCDVSVFRNKHKSQ